MARRNYFIFNMVKPSLQAPSNTFDVTEGAVRLVAAGLSATDKITVQVCSSAVAGRSGMYEEYWTPLFRGGREVTLTAKHNQHIELVAGRYRLVHSGLSATAVVALTEDEDTLDGRIMYTYEGSHADNTPASSLEQLLMQSLTNNLNGVSLKNNAGVLVGYLSPA